MRINQVILFSVTVYKKNRCKYYKVLAASVQEGTLFLTEQYEFDSDVFPASGTHFKPALYNYNMGSTGK